MPVVSFHKKILDLVVSPPKNYDSQLSEVIPQE